MLKPEKSHTRIFSRAGKDTNHGQSGIRGKRTHYFFSWPFSITRQEIIQFTCHTSAKTVMLNTFFHSENQFLCKRFSVS